MTENSYSAFQGFKKIAQGGLPAVSAAVRAAEKSDPQQTLLVFDDTTGAVVDLDPRGLAEQMPVPRGRGRPKLGVIAREVTLLQRHWDWLAAQPGGASQALRRLVDAARRADGGISAARQAREAAYRFMAGIAGDLPGFEEASRALFADNRAAFHRHAAAWPADIRAHAEAVAWGD